MARGRTSSQAGAALSARASARSAGARSSATIPSTIGGVSFLGHEYSPQYQGQIIGLNHAQAITVGDDIGGHIVGRYGMQGLDAVMDTQIQADGTVVVTFTNGDRCVVDLSSHTISGDVPGVPSPEAVAAIYHALATKAQSDPRYEPLAQALAAYQDQRGSLAALALAAHAGEQALQLGDGFQVAVAQEVPRELDQRLADLREALKHGTSPRWLSSLPGGIPEGMSPMSLALYPNNAAVQAEALKFSDEDWDAQDMRAAIDKIAAIMGDGQIAARAEGLTSKEELSALAGELTEQIDFGIPAPAALAARLRAARTIPGLRTYDTNPNYHVDELTDQAFTIFANEMVMGTRSFGLYGPPGTGKNAFIYEIAASTGMPVFEVDMAAGDSVRDLIGDVGLKDGNTTLQVGPMARAACAKGGVIVSLNEWVSAPRAEQTAIHNLLGSGSDQTKDRFITFKAPEDSESTRMDIDPDTLFFLTWNPGRGDEAPNPAVLRRISPFALEYGTSDEQAKRMCFMLQPALDKLMDFKGMDASERQGWTYDASLTRTDKDGNEVPVPITEQCPDLAHECERAVMLAQELRTRYQEGEVNHYMDSTTLARFVQNIVRETYFGDEIAATDPAEIQATKEQQAARGVSLALSKLDFMFPQDLPREERLTLAEEAAAAIYSDRMGPIAAGGINR